MPAWKHLLIGSPLLASRSSNLNSFDNSYVFRLTSPAVYEHTGGPPVRQGKFRFYDERVYVEVYPRGQSETYALSINVDCCHLDWQVISVVMISYFLSQIFSAVEDLFFEHEMHSQSSEEHNEVDHTE